MKKFEELLKEINSTYENIKAIKAEKEKISDDYMQLIRGMSFAEKCTYRKEHEAEIKEKDLLLVELSQKKERQEIRIQLLKNNARVALYNEVMPIALEILEKYKNKPYGERTSQKISDAVKEKTNCAFRIYSRYSGHEFSIIPMMCGNEYNLEVSTKYISGNQKPLLIDNKIQLVEMDDLQLYYNHVYYENIEETIDKMIELHAEAKKKQAELEEICSQFNTLAPRGIKSLNARESIYNNLI